MGTEAADLPIARISKILLLSSQEELCCRDYPRIRTRLISHFSNRQNQPLRNYRKEQALLIE